MDKVMKFSDIYTLSRAAAERFVTLARECIEEHGHFSVAFSGGSTPESLYALLATDTYAPRIEWDKVHVFWGDERCVPPKNTDSNYRMAHYALLDLVDIPEANIHRMRGEDPPEEAAATYEQELREFFGEKAAWPRFDLIFLGLGDDGHTASLFPNSDALSVTKDWVTAHYVKLLRVWRLTLTAPSINAANNVLFLVSGSKKASVLQKVLQAPYSPDDLPAQMINPIHGSLVWLVDEEAGELI